MRKNLRPVLTVAVVLLFAISASLNFAGGKKEPEVIEKEAPVEKIIEVEKESPYTFEKLLVLQRYFSSTAA